MKLIKRLLACSSIIIAIVLVFQLSYSIDQTISKTTLAGSHTVVIDAGHGGKDVGAVGVDGSNEKDTNLAISLDLYDFFRVCGINSVLTRNADYQTYFVEQDRTKEDIYNRMDVVNNTPNSILISIHQNHFDDEREWGAQVWYSANNEESKALASSISSSVKELLQPDNNRSDKVSDDSYYLLYKAKSPSVMVECGFTSNIEENKKLQAPDYQSDMAFAIMLGALEEV